jgi:DNA-binding NarL/FixJ family response regulator
MALEPSHPQHYDPTRPGPSSSELVRPRKPSGDPLPGHLIDRPELSGMGAGLELRERADATIDEHLVRVMIVDDHGLFRRGLARILATYPDIRVVAETGEAETVPTARRVRPEVILLIGESSVAKNVDDLVALFAAAPKSKVVVLAVLDEPRWVKHLLSLGAHAYVLKSATEEELITTIRAVSRYNDRVMLSVSRQTLDTLRGGDGLLLSERELEVLALVADGKRNSEIAAQLFIAEGTVKRHLTNIYAKLGATSRTDAVRKAVSRGHALYVAVAGVAAERYLA